MPIGSFTAVPHFAMELCSRRPARVLDLGIGSGFLGAVVRQWVDLGARPWGTFLVGVEAWADYRNPLWDLYNLVVVDTIERYLDRHPETFGAVLLGDVLEHFGRDDGYELIGKLRTIVEPGASSWSPPRPASTGRPRRTATITSAIDRPGRPRTSKPWASGCSSVGTSPRWRTSPRSSGSGRHRGESRDRAQRNSKLCSTKRPIVEGVNQSFQVFRAMDEQ